MGSSAEMLVGHQQLRLFGISLLTGWYSMTDVLGRRMENLTLKNPQPLAGIYATSLLGIEIVVTRSLEPSLTLLNPNLWADAQLKGTVAEYVREATDEEALSGDVDGGLLDLPLGGR